MQYIDGKDETHMYFFVFVIQSFVNIKTKPLNLL